MAALEEARTPDLPVQDAAKMAEEEGDSTGEGTEKTEIAEVHKKRKRKLKSVEMEVSDGTAATKRPSFPPVDASLTLVRCLDEEWMEKWEMKPKALALYSTVEPSNDRHTQMDHFVPL